MAAARGIPIPPADEVPPELEYKMATGRSEDRQARQTEKGLNNLMVPITSRSQSVTSDSSTGARLTPIHSQSPAAPSSSGPHLFRGRAKTLASLTTSSKSTPSDMAPRELQLPHDPFVNGQPVEVYLYKNGSECPICFLYYPPYLNKTRCCDQPICSECFVQIKRADPHPPEHDNPDPNAPPQPEGQRQESDGQLVSEPAACPFCVQPEFGVSYDPPQFRRGLTYSANHNTNPVSFVSPKSSSSSVVSGNINTQSGAPRRRATSLSADAPNVITTDKVRPDWAQKLATARANAARRSAAATALHTAAYMVNTPGNSNEARNFGHIGRRNMLRRATGHDSPNTGGNSSHLDALSRLAERRAAERENNSTEEGSANIAPPRASSRRGIDELEDMMMMEAIRLSLAAEEERRKKEEKEAKKEAKRREKEAKKAEKYGKKNHVPISHGSNAVLNPGSGSSAGKSGVEQPPNTLDSSADKGKGVDRTAPPPTKTGSNDETESPLHPSGASIVESAKKESSTHPPNNPHAADPEEKSHLRHISSASSSNSSLVESAFGEQKGSSTPPHGSNSDPLFNFRSLDAMVDDEEDKPREPTGNTEDTTQSALGSDIPEESAQDHKTSLDQESPSPDPISVDGKEIQAHSAEVLPPSTLGTTT